METVEALRISIINQLFVDCLAIRAESFTHSNLANLLSSFLDSIFDFF